MASDAAAAPHWKGLIIAEGLDDPGIIRDFTVYRAAISPPNRPIDTQGTLGRRHYYWITCADAHRPTVVDALRTHVLPGWYAHLWNDRSIVAIFHRHVFELDRHDRTTWRPDTELGLSQGITERELDFLTD
jgi:hypothetical protein